MEIGTKVKFKHTDTVYPLARGEIIKVDARDDRPYFGIHIPEGEPLFYEVGHTVWRYEDQLEAV